MATTKPLVGNNKVLGGMWLGSVGLGQRRNMDLYFGAAHKNRNFQLLHPSLALIFYLHKL